MEMTRNNRRTGRFFAVLMVIALIMAACGSDDGNSQASDDTGVDSSTEETTSPDTEPETGEPDEQDEEEEPDSEPSGDEALVVAIGQDITVRDQRLPGNSAAAFSANRHITEPLTFFDATGDNVEPLLAESWEQIEPNRWQFALRQGVTFHNGASFNADTAVYSFEKSLDPDFGTWYGFVIDSVIESVEKVDEYTIDIVTTSPQPQLPNMISVVDMVDPAYDEGEAQNIAPVGTGPYMFNEYVPLSQYVMDRFDDYWGGPEAYSQITWRIIPEQSTRVQALLAGEVSAINAVSVEDISRISDEGGFEISSSPTTRLIMIALRHDRAPLDNPLVRQAMNYAVDKQLIVDTLLPGIAVPADGILASSIPGSNGGSLGPWPYDPDRARELLEEAGYNDEPITIAVGAGRYPSDDEVGLAVVSQLQEVGLNIQLEAVDYSTMQSELSNRADASYDGWLQGWGSFYLSPTYELQGFFGGEDAALPLFYENPDYDEAIGRALTAENLEELAGPSSEAEQIAWEDAGGIYLYFPVDSIAHVEELEGFSARIDEFFFFSDTTIG